MNNYNNYGLHRQNAVGFSTPQQTFTPPNTLSDGIAPAGRFIVAAYLPHLRYNEEKFTDVVISSGKLVAFDSAGKVVPAGLKKDAEAFAAGKDAVIKYTAFDVQRGVRNFAGNLVTAGEAVVASFFDANKVLINGISFFSGVAQYDILQNAGGDNITPTTIDKINFNRQPVISFLADYHMQYPVVKDQATLDTAALVGIAAVVAAPGELLTGAFITYDAHSNFVPCVKGGYGYGDADKEAIVGQVTAVKVFRDATTGKVVDGVDRNFLDKVVAPNVATASVLNKVASNQTEGLGTYLTLSNGYAIAEFGIQTR
ncbi:MAG: hypothetical protein [Bacteriophage sp.]|nr:MAG: hypothetical protein [Bacteriophage sp.]